MNIQQGFTVFTILKGIWTYANEPQFLNDQTPRGHYICNSWVNIRQGVTRFAFPEGWGYTHDCRADKYPYPHDRRADKDSYPHDRNVTDDLCSLI